MKTLFQSNALMEAIGWTLLNSVWQAMAVLFVLAVVLRFIPLRVSHTRYVVSCAAIGVFLLLNIFSFFSVFDSTVMSTEAVREMQFLIVTQNNVEATGNSSWLSIITSAVSEYMPWIMLCWAIGTTFFVMRIIAGWWYIHKLRMNAIMLPAWSDRVAELASELHIFKSILVAESEEIDSPMVVGVVKPIILIPMGMVSGLSTDQLESIFIHELAHIKRYDYLVNVMQTIVESIFFFNPFVWIISNIIRREREYCCDDAVVTTRGTSLAYVRTLAQLEEIRMTTPRLVVSLTGHKNQLLNRIKRIMEKSTRNYSNMDKVIPALLLVVGLVCASWLTINSEKYQERKKLAAADTTKKRSRSGSYSKSTVITRDKDGKPHEEVVEEYSGDEDLRPFLAMEDPIAPVPMEEIFDFPIPPHPLADVETFEFPAAPTPFFDINGDTVPKGRAFYYGREWKEFGEEFEKKFSEQFSDFYKQHGKEFEKMMKELETQFEKSFEDGEFIKIQELAMSEAEQARMAADMARVQAKMAQGMQDDMLKMKEKVDQQMQTIQLDQLEKLKKLELNMDGQRDHLKKLERDLKGMEKRMKEFETALKEELVKDGYVKKGEELKEIRWDDNEETLEVNGVKIKAADQKKYRELHRKYFDFGTGRSE